MKYTNKLLIKLLSILALFSTEKLHSQLFIVNSTNETIYTCIAWYNESISGYTTRGWYNISPGDTISPGLYFTSENDEFYYYATSNKNLWEGTYPLLTRKESFEIHYAEIQNTQDINKDYEWRNFTKKSISFHNTEKIFYLNFITEENTPQSESVLSGEYHDNFNQTITLEGEYFDESIKFTINGQTTQSCLGNEITGNAVIHRINIRTLGPDYNGPEYFYEYSDETGCTIEITPHQNSNSITIYDNNCNYYRGASCGIWSGEYLKH
jgi:hypothetical protein